MVLDAVSNFVRGTADAEVGTDDTTVSVADASIFPDPATDGEFNVVIWDVNNFPRPDQDGDVEILRVTARDTTADELTVTRGQETTSAAAHPEGSAIHLSPTAKMFSDIKSTFGDFWDAGTQELTADVNNTNTTTTGLEAESSSVEEQSVKTSWQDETTNRDLDNWYQAPDYDIEVAVTPIVDEDNSTITVNFNVNDEQSQQRIYRIRTNGPAEEFTRVGSTFSVPANHYYRVDISGDADNVSLDIWFERR